MNFRQKNNFGGKTKERKFPLFYFYSFIIFVLFFSFSFSRNVIFKIISPLWNTKANFVAFISSNNDVLKSKSALIDENINLKKQISDFEKEKILNGLIRKENEDLKGILGRKESNQKLVLAAVLIKPFLSPYDTLVIDTGLTDGVSVGDKVMADGNVFIGYVSEVYDNSSKVTLYSSPGEKTKVLIGKNNVEKEAVGLGGGNFKVEMPRESDLKEGDNVVMPSISTNIFSVVQELDFKETDFFQSVLFKSPININELKWVEVLPTIKK